MSRRRLSRSARRPGPAAAGSGDHRGRQDANRLWRVGRRRTHQLRGSAEPGDGHAACSAAKVAALDAAQPGAHRMTDSTALATIDLDALALIHGGDAWQDYKDTLSKDWQDVKTRYNQAVNHNLRSGNWNFGEWADGYAGTVFNGGKMAWDATGGQVGGAIAKLFK
jgi:hypothetical protein